MGMSASGPFGVAIAGGLERQGVLQADACPLQIAQQEQSMALVPAAAGSHRRGDAEQSVASGPDLVYLLQCSPGVTEPQFLAPCCLRLYQQRSGMQGAGDQGYRMAWSVSFGSRACFLGRQRGGIG